MNILHVIPGDLWGGAESQVYYMLSGIHEEKKHDVNIVLFNEGILCQKLKRNGIPVIVLDESRLSSLKITSELRKEIKRIAPDIIHVHEYKSHVLTVLATLGIKNVKIVRTIHGRTGVPLKLKFLKTHVVFFLEKVFIKLFTKKVIAVSKDLETYFQKEYGRNKVFLIYNSVISLETNRNEAAQIRKALHINDSTFWIVTAARLVPIKNLSLLIKAAKILKENDTIPDFKISIFGDGPLKETLINEINVLGVTGNVQLHGFHEDIYDVFAAADVFVLPSFHEGMPMSLLEAMAFGTVPVCTEVGGMKEIIKNGETGFLTESNNAEKMAAIFSKIYSAPEEKVQISNNCKKYIKDHFSIRTGLKYLMQLYEEVSG